VHITTTVVLCDILRIFETEYLCFSTVSVQNLFMFQLLLTDGNYIVTFWCETVSLAFPMAWVPLRFQLTTLGKLFTHACLCHQAVWFSTGQGAVMPRWEGNRRSGVALATRHRLQCRGYPPTGFAATEGRWSPRLRFISSVPQFAVMNDTYIHILFQQPREHT